jgi:hypothetical protein
VLTCLNLLPCLPRTALIRCIWSAVGNVSKAISGGVGAEQRRLVEDDLRYIDDDMLSSWIGGGAEDVNRTIGAQNATGFGLSPRDGEGASSVMQAVDESISGLVRSAAHLRYENAGCRDSFEDSCTGT